MVGSMKLNRSELSGTVIVSTNSVLNSLTTLLFILNFDVASQEILESFCENLPNYGKTINFAESVLAELSGEAREQVLENLKLIYQVIEKNNKKIVEIYFNE
jgi:regulator of sigma D